MARSIPGSPENTFLHMLFLFFQKNQFPSGPTHISVYKTSLSIISAGFKDRLLTPESLAEQQAILTLAACPQAPDPAECEQWVATYWAGIAKVLFTWLTDVKDPCGSLGLGLCKK